MSALASALRDTIGRSERAGRTGARAGLLAILLLGAVALLTPAATAATPADTAATHAYLLARYTLTRELIANAPRATAGARAVADRLAGECPGVLAGAPRQPRFIASAPVGVAVLTPRQRGEAALHQHQLSTLEEELQSSVLGAAYATDQAAYATFTTTTAKLSWSDPEVAEAVSSEAALIAFTRQPVAPDVCGDMRSWVASGYRELSAASKAFRSEQQEGLAKLIAYDFTHSTEQLLKRYEGRSERALARRTAALEVRERAASAGALSAATSAAAALGAPVEEGEASGEAHGSGHVVGRGRTLTGASFTVTVTPIPRGGRGANPCRFDLSVEYGTEPEGLGSGTSSCTSGPRSAPDLTVGCEDGQITLESRTLVATRTVRLSLSNGHSVSSRVILVPKRLGGPFGVYVQALRGPSPIPVSLAELDANGRQLRVVRIPAQRHCHKLDAASVPLFKVIVSGTTAGGTPFKISGASVPGRSAPELILNVDAGDELFGGALASIAVGALAPPQLHPVAELKTECTPHQFAILYDQLTTPGATMLAQTPSGLIALQQVALPASLHGRGVLVYGAFTSVPSEVIVRAADGATIAHESFVARAKEEGEFCEGSLES